MILDVLGWSVALAGALLVLVGAVGMVSLPDLFMRIHAAGIIDTLGSALVLAGLAVVEGFTTTSARLLLILAFLWITGPTACHALARCARASGVQPWTPRSAEDGQQSGNRDPS